MLPTKPQRSYDGGLLPKLRGTESRGGILSFLSAQKRTASQVVAFVAARRVGVAFVARQSEDPELIRLTLQACVASIVNAQSVREIDAELKRRAEGN